MAGSRLASYEVAEEIGRGGMAVVYRARDVLLDRWVAVKHFAGHYVIQDGVITSFNVRQVGSAAHPRAAQCPVADHRAAGRR